MGGASSLAAEVSAAFLPSSEEGANSFSAAAPAASCSPASSPSSSFFSSPSVAAEGAANAASSSVVAAREGDTDGIWGILIRFLLISSPMVTVTVLTWVSPSSAASSSPTLPSLAPVTVSTNRFRQSLIRHRLWRVGLFILPTQNTHCPQSSVQEHPSHPPHRYVRRYLSSVVAPAPVLPRRRS